MPSTASDERVPGESDDEELPPAAGPSAPGPSFLDATDTTVIRIDDSPLVLPPSVDPDDDGTFGIGHAQKLLTQQSLPTAAGPNGAQESNVRCPLPRFLGREALLLLARASRFQRGHFSAGSLQLGLPQSTSCRRTSKRG